MLEICWVCISSPRILDQQFFWNWWLTPTGRIWLNLSAVTVMLQKTSGWRWRSQQSLSWSPWNAFIGKCLPMQLFVCSIISKAGHTTLVISSEPNCGKILKSFLSVASFWGLLFHFRWTKLGWRFLLLNKEGIERNFCCSQISAVLRTWGNIFSIIYLFWCKTRNNNVMWCKPVLWWSCAFCFLPQVVFPKFLLSPL